MVGDHGRAEDITQDVFISALRRMRDSERPIAFKPWIYEIAKNACIDDFRRVRRAREVPIGADGELEHENPRLIGRTQTPDVAIEHRQQLTDLRGAFRGLSENHHQIIVLRELEGLSYAEIGDRMGMSRPVVESTLFRARRRLSDEYDELVSGRRCTHVQDVISERGPRAFRSLGIKERRLVARHLAHCQPCRSHAYMHGFDSSVLQPPTVVGKIAAILPIPAIFRLRHSAGGAGAGSRVGRAVAAARSRAVDALQSAQSATTYVDPSAPAAGISRLAAAAATLAIAGAGGGLIVATSGSTSHRSPHVVSAAAAGAGSKLGRASRHRACRVRQAGRGSRRTPQATGSRGARGLTLAKSGSGNTSRAGVAGRGGCDRRNRGEWGYAGRRLGHEIFRERRGPEAVAVTSGVSNVVNTVLNNVPKVESPESQGQPAYPADGDAPDIAIAVSANRERVGHHGEWVPDPAP